MKFESEEYGEVQLINYVDLKINDQAFVLEMRNHVSVRRWMYTQKMISNDEHEEFFEKLKTSKEVYYFLVKLQDTIVGSINFSNIALNRSLHFGLYANPFASLKRSGRILEAAGSHYAHSVFGAGKIMLEVFPDNIRAINFYKKCGFVLDGVNKVQGKDVFLMYKTTKLSLENAE